VPGIEILAQILLDEGLGSLVLFELLQAVADHRGRQAQVAAGRRQAAALDHPDEDPDVLEQRHRADLRAGLFGSV
jgi:hypothetical protein